MTDSEPGLSNERRFRRREPERLSPPTEEETESRSTIIFARQSETGVDLEVNEWKGTDADDALTQIFSEAGLGETPILDDVQMRLTEIGRAEMVSSYDRADKHEVLEPVYNSVVLASLGLSIIGLIASVLLSALPFIAIFVVATLFLLYAYRTGLIEGSS